MASEHAVFMFIIMALRNDHKALTGHTGSDDDAAVCNTCYFLNEAITELENIVGDIKTKNGDRYNGLQ